MSITPEQIAALLPVLNDIQNSRFTSAAGITLAVYDALLVLPDEVETIYRSRWTAPKALYFYLRVVTPPGLLLATYQLSNFRGPLNDSLYSMGNAPNLPHAFFIGLRECLRLVALYRRNRYVVWFIHFFFAASYGACLGIVIDATVYFHGSFFYSTLIGICATNATSSTFPAIFYAPLAFEVFVFALTAFRAVQDAKILTGSGSAPFLLVLYRDGLISFIVMLTMRLWNIWIYVTGPVSSFNLGTMLMWSISTVLTTRVYMNLVWLANRPLLDPTSWHTDIPLSTSLAIGTGTHIRMHVTTFTEIHVDRRDPKRPSALAGLGLDNGIREEEQGSI